MTALLPPDLADMFELACCWCGRPADRVVDEVGLQRLMSPRVPMLPRSGMTGEAVRMDPSGITSVTAADLAPLGLLCGRHEPRPPGGPPYNLLDSVR